MPAGAAAASSVATLVQKQPRDAGHVVLLSAELTPSSSVAHAAAFTYQAADAPAALQVGPALKGAPSAWAEAAKARRARAAQPRRACMC